MTSKSLTDKQKLFVAIYVADPNATTAAKMSGYSEKSARNQGNRMMKNDDIRQAIDQGLKEKHSHIKLKGVKLIQKIEQIVEDTTDTKSDLYNPHAALKAILYLGRELGMRFATERHEVVSHGDIAKDIYEGRKRLKQFRARYRPREETQD